MTGNAALAAGVQRLTEAGVPTPSRDARRLMAHALDIPPDRLTLVLPDLVAPAALARFEAAISARCHRQPVAQIIGYRDFFGRRFAVTQDVLDPRPETERLVLAALASPARRVLDLGTGTGCLLVTLLAEWPEAVGVGVDISEPALGIAARNAEALGVSKRAVFRRADWCADLDGAFDLVVANPPYVTAAEMAALDEDVRRWEPEQALCPGGDGLDAYRAIAADVRGLMAPGARLLLEIGPSQAGAVSALVRAAGLEDIEILPDLDGRDRVVAAKAPVSGPKSRGFG
ncbi:MAG: peptide chain release factor N(5)-glutamine methyltransferase [Pseudomonadota bacterium]